MEVGEGGNSNSRVNGKNQRDLKLLTVDDVKKIRFKSLAAAKSFYKRYAFDTGFVVQKQGTIRDRDGCVTMIRWVCDRGASCKKKNLEDSRHSTRADCPAEFCISKGYVSGRWFVRDFVVEHTHELGCRSNPEIDQPSQLVDYLASLGTEDEDLSNSMDASYGSYISFDDAEAAQFYFTQKKDSERRVFYELDFVDSHLARIFFADSMAELDCSCFGDVVAVYRTNSSDLHFVILFSLNHHHQTTILGFAILSDESVEAYTWMFQRFLDVMKGCMPLSIVIDDNKALGKAAKLVLPNSRCRLCTWHLEKSACSNVDEYFMVDFKALMLEDLSPDEFELGWKAMVDMYMLSDNPWIQKMYRKRHEWAETYLRGHFWAGLRSTKVCQVLDGYLSRLSLQNLKLNQVINLYDNAVIQIRMNEAKADYDSNYSEFVPSTKIKKQASDAFTIESYRRFLSEMQLEMILVVSEIDDSDSNCRKYKLVKMENQELVYEVMFKPSGQTPTIECSCLKFETFGFPCSHVLHVLKYEGFKEIPQNLMHPRWTKLAKSTAQFWKNYLPLVSSDVVPRMMRYGTAACSISPMLYMGTQSEEAFNIVSGMFVKLKDEVNRRNNSVLGVEHNKVI